MRNLLITLMLVFNTNSSFADQEISAKDFAADLKKIFNLTSTSKKVALFHGETTRGRPCLVMINFISKTLKIERQLDEDYGLIGFSDAQKHFKKQNKSVAYTTYYGEENGPTPYGSTVLHLYKVKNKITIGIETQTRKRACQVSL